MINDWLLFVFDEQKPFFFCFSSPFLMIAEWWKKMVWKMKIHEKVLVAENGVINFLMAIKTINELMD